MSFVAECLTTVLHTEVVAYATNLHRYTSASSGNDLSLLSDDAAPSDTSSPAEDDVTAEDRQGGYVYRVDENGTSYICIGPLHRADDDASNEETPLQGEYVNIVFRTLEEMGYTTGRRFAEVLLHHDTLVDASPKGAIRFISRKIWPAVFAKQFDRVQGTSLAYHCHSSEGGAKKDGTSSHRPTFELTDNDFRWVRCSVPKEEHELEQSAMASPYFFPPTTDVPQAFSLRKLNAETAECPPHPGPQDYTIVVLGMIRGVLTAMGWPQTIVSASLKAPRELTLCLKFL